MGEKEAISNEQDNTVREPAEQGNAPADAGPASDIADALCPACGGLAPGVAVASPVDYEYGVETARGANFAAWARRLHVRCRLTGVRDT